MELIDLVVLLGAILGYRIMPYEWRNRPWVRGGLLLSAGMYVFYRQLAYRPERLGLGIPFWDNAPLIAGITIGGIFALMFVAFRMGNRIRLNRNLIVCLVFYPALGFIQQYLMLSYINVRLHDLGIEPLTSALVTAVAFASLHTTAAFWIATGCMGFIFSLCFQHQPNLILFGISHGWLATFFYYWVLEEDPIAKDLPWLHKTPAKTVKSTAQTKECK